MRVLFIGGTGIISSGCAPAALKAGIDLHFLVRGKSDRDIMPGVVVHHANVRDSAAVRAALGDLTFDAVVDFVAFVPDHIRQDIELFKDRTGQFVFISSASAYQSPPNNLPVTESTVLENPYWEYSRNKIACEEVLVEAYRQFRFPYTIVRPSHTYDERLLPFDHAWTVVDRMRKGKPVIVPGDGTSLWVLTHHTDFAKAFVPLLGNNRAIGEAFHITSDEWLTWNQIFDLVAEAAGTKAIKVHVPSDVLARFDPGWGPGLLGDKANSMVFDNTKVKRLAPGFDCTTSFREGAKQIIAWYDADPARQVVDEKADAFEDLIISKMTSVMP